MSPLDGSPSWWKEAISLYLEGNSIVQVGNIMGRPHSTVAHVIKKAGIARSIGAPGVLKAPNSTNRATLCRRARAAWERTNGRKIPKGWHVHHVDGDPSNNDPENLVIISPGAHSSMHWTPERKQQQAEIMRDRLLGRTKRESA